jgi:hypothetical protein
MEKKEPLLKGSIRVAKNQVFYEERSVKGIEISYEGITATMIPSCLSEKLNAIFTKLEEFGLDWQITKNDKPKTVKEIKGIVFDEIVEVDEEHLRIRFNADTPSEFEDRRDRIIAYIETHNIEYGEPDGSVACIWVCVAKGRQTELTGEYLEKLDRLRRTQK